MRPTDKTVRAVVQIDFASLDHAKAFAALLRRDHRDTMTAAVQRTGKQTTDRALTVDVLPIK